MYFAFLSLQNIWIALILLGISIIQVIPPIIIKKYMQTNYDEYMENENFNNYKEYFKKEILKIENS